MDRPLWAEGTSFGRLYLAVLAAAVGLLLVAVPIAAQENDECLMCHEDAELTGIRDGEEIPVHVDRARYAASAHAEVECVACHQDLVDAELPHQEDVEPVDCSFCHDSEAAEHARSLHGRAAARGNEAAPGCADCHGRHDIRVAPVECGSCHGSQAAEHARSLHGQAAARGDELAPSCADCHGAHDIKSHTDPSSPTAIMSVPLLCGRCHHEGTEVSLTHDIPQDRILENYSLSIHGEGLFTKGLTVTAVCTSCHTSHNILPHDDPASSIHRDRVASTCTACHAQIEHVHRAVIEGHLWQEEPHKIPACADCHSPHKIRRVFYPAGMADQDCLKCHADPGLTMERDGVAVSLYVDEEKRLTSDHAGTACAQCHTDVTVSRVRPCETIASPVDCAVCHAQQVSEFRTSTHGTLLAQGDPDAPTCQDCHGKHAELDSNLPISPTFPRNVPFLCAKCHRAGERAAVRIEAEVSDIVQSYVDSIHGTGLTESGLVVTATCANCHSAHKELPSDDPRSTIHRDNIADTCGTCHHGIEETFRTSIHWPENTDTDRELPTCEDCHTSHTIRRTDLPGFRLVMMEQCGRCHETEATTFFDTFHGKVSRLGSEGAAKCYDCHGTHDILPTSDPDSHLNRRNVVETCAQCHEGAHRRFAGYLTHATHHDADRYPWLFWSFWFMTALLVGTLSFALLHTGMWLVRLWLSRDQWKAHKALSRVGDEKVYRRFSRLQRTLHMLMLISFFTLALTGMALKFSYMGWAQTLSWLLGGFNTMGVLHRMGAVTIFGIFAVHLWDVCRMKRQSGGTWKELLTGSSSILFNLNDVREIVQSIKWFFGLGPRPSYGRYTYWEKFDYFAVFWGIAVIGSTGLVLWFPEFFTYLLPGWSVNVATIVHSDEALLAVGFIFTIHFFNTHFRPDKFPMDPVIFTGRVTVAELEYDKPAEYEDLVARGELEQKLIEPMATTTRRALKSVGFVFLSIGLLLIALIVYTMLFGYR